MPLTVREIAAALRLRGAPCSESTALRYVSEWHAKQSDPNVPRVTTAKTGKRGRPAFHVDAESFGRWCLGAARMAA